MTLLDGADRPGGPVSTAAEPLVLTGAKLVPPEEHGERGDHVYWVLELNNGQQVALLLEPGARSAVIVLRPGTCLADAMESDILSRCLLEPDGEVVVERST